MRLRPATRRRWYQVLAAVTLLVFACVGGGGADLPPPPSEIPTELAEGAGAFDRHCASCHGTFARGTETGPPLVHPYYVPSHHGDAAFRFAVERGVAAHHWRFGDMPPQPQVTPAEVEEIVAYVRWLQREAGIE
jgi:mono/diheme cytochrome c family protein